MNEPQLIVPVEGKYRAAEFKSYERGCKQLFPESFNIQKVLSFQGDLINPSSLMPFGPSINLGELSFTLESRICGGGYAVSVQDVDFGTATLYAVCKRIVEEGKRCAQQAQAPFVAVAAQMIASPSGEIPLNNPIQRIRGTLNPKRKSLMTYSFDDYKPSNDLKEAPEVLTQAFRMSPTAQLYLPR